jgi:twinfilin-like protein
MLYASSASSLKDGLGSSLFMPDISISSPSECTLANYQNSIKVVKRADIMTMDEIMKMEEQTAAAMAMGSTKSAAIADLPLAVADEAQSALKRLVDTSENKAGSVLLQLHPRTEVLQPELVGNFKLEELAAKLPKNEPRYCLHRFTHEYEGKQMSPLVFVYYCPDAASPKQKMTYSSCKSIVVKVAEKNNIVITKQVEISEPQELSVAALTNELYPKQSEKKVFAKPKKPGKKPVGLTSGTKFATDK